MLKLNRRLLYGADSGFFIRCFRRSPSYPLVKPPQSAYGVLYLEGSL